MLWKPHQEHIETDVASLCAAPPNGARAAYAAFVVFHSAFFGDQFQPCGQNTLRFRHHGALDRLAYELLDVFRPDFGVLRT